MKKSLKSAKPAAPAKSVSAAKSATGTTVIAERKSFPETARIVVIATANPKRPGTKAHAKWAFYAKAKTVGDLVKAFAAAKYPRRRAMSALRWDSGHGFIKVG